MADVKGSIESVRPGVRAGRLNNGAMSYVRHWVNDKVPGATLVVLTDGPAAGGQPGIYYNLSPGRRVLVTGMDVDVGTEADNCHFELGYTDAANGAGNFTPVTGHRHIHTAAGRSGFTGYEVQFETAIPIRYSDGARSITFRVNANDASCEVTPEWAGWDEPDV